MTASLIAKHGNIRKQTEKQNKSRENQGRAIVLNYRVASLGTINIQNKPKIKDFRHRLISKNMKTISGYICSKNPSLFLLFQQKG